MSEEYFSNDDALIQGSGGGGGGKGGGGGSIHVATEANDTLRSIQYAKVLDAVCEGEIVGLVNGMQSVFFDDVPLQNSNGTYNFLRATVTSRVGTQSQTPIIGFDKGVEAEIGVGVIIMNATPITRTANAASVSIVRVTLSVPRLVYQDPSNGDMSGSSVQYKISIQSNGGGFVDQVVNGSTTITLSGKTTSKYTISYEFNLTGVAPHDIKVSRLSADPLNLATQNQLYWDSYTEIVPTTLNYPNTALVGVQIDGLQFKSIPRRSYRLKLMKINIPNNYNPITRVYTGVWNGGFTVAWTDNPAWCFYDLVTNTRYGLGEFIPAAWVNKADLYTIAQYCDELVPNGFGGFEPRFTCNLYLQNQEDAFKLIQNMASIFRAMLYWQGGTITPVADKPEAVWAQFTNADVVEGIFSYQGSANRARHTVALVTWNDPAERYRQKVEYVEDTDGINRYGVNQLDVAAMGCTSRGQAHRLGKWLLYSERLETDIVTFKTSVKGINLVPGKVINTLDQYRAGQRNAGRIVSSTSTSITIDAPIPIDIMDFYTITLEMPDGTLVTRPLTNPTGSATVLTWVTPLTTQPLNGTIWMASETTLAPETWRVLSITEEASNTYLITALQHNTSKFGFIEQDLMLVIPPTSIYSDVNTISPIVNPVASDSVYKLSNSTLATKMTVSWQPVAGA